MYVTHRTSSITLCIFHNSVLTLLQIPEINFVCTHGKKVYVCACGIENEIHIYIFSSIYLFIYFLLIAYL